MPCLASNIFLFEERSKMPNQGMDLTFIHKAFIGFDKRAERASNEILEATFVDSAPLFELLSTNNNQVIYGRRGTGKTHALKYLAKQVEKQGEHPIYVDLRSVGSNGSIYSDESRPLSERAATLIIDVLNALNDELITIALGTLESVPDQSQLYLRVDDFSASIRTVQITGTIEEETESITTETDARGAAFNAKVAKSPSATLALGTNRSASLGTAARSKRTGTELVHLNFGNLGASLSALISVLGAPRIWLLIDEWSEVPVELQPYLADLLRRTVLPIQAITIKIAAIEHRSSFALLKSRGAYVGLELGADVAADLNLDDFLVFDNNQHKATTFFKTLLYRHYASSDKAEFVIQGPDELIQAAFTQWNAFEEFVRAVEGVPRDALNLAAKIATKSFGQKIAMQHVRWAARDWYQQDKQALIRSNPELSALLARVIDDIIGKRKARAFLFPSNARDPRIEQLFDSRVLHILKKNISSKDEPGIRYDVYKIDYGCYVDLINTLNMPQGLFQVEEETVQAEHFVEVPRDDYRSIRRAVLRPSDLDLPPGSAS
jgi:hypothetical protein